MRMAEMQNGGSTAKVDPLPLVKLMAARSGCFAVADRGAAFDALERERALAGGTARFHGFDWAAGRPHAEERCVLPRGIVVIEGVCALHRRFRDAYDVRIWVDAPYEVRLARGIERDGDEARRIWE